ncbi:enoyl-CoA hydratase/isomerase domain-containing protein [Hirsutella rhossiliensis]|uniref:Enoyl-CoA hydratase/isomerase domain-containing protein n=1 Tax=Hirsutella rhossiliensis TaxID=111463 RepID=A0A9P8MUW8_9HYPO|nr:enoyl-CoA hydratase/isomerase domain-containing protein [Hirsutella rhossiliensis]KAH0961690.1 enoyl-CoA hydratase/isomerase domain-containing protein [Hirsutella rhossiliensis]
MRILFLCTAHNSLSQRLSLALSRDHSVTVEYALSEAIMVEAVDLVKPHLVICPFLTTRVPQQVYNHYLTLIMHPGPPGDAGPSALDWLLMGDDGNETDSDRLLLNDAFNASGRSYWGVTVLQAVKEFDAGPVWAFDQFPININEPGLTKSSLYRGPITQAAVSAVITAIGRIEAAARLKATILGEPLSPPHSPACDGGSLSLHHSLYTNLIANQAFGRLCVSSTQPFKGGQTHRRPLLKASQREFDPQRHSAAEISRRLRSSDSQPGCLSTIFGPRLYLYGGIVEDVTFSLAANGILPGSIVACRDEAVCIASCDGKGVWVTHVRRVKTKSDAALWPKVPAVSGLTGLGCSTEPVMHPDWLLSHSPPTFGTRWCQARHGTHQEIWVDFVCESMGVVAYVHFDFYNGAMSTKQCRRLSAALDHVLSGSQRPSSRRLAALVLMGGRSYFSNGIHLNVIEAAADPAQESWHNINAINDIVECILCQFPGRGIATLAAIRGNCAAGGVALATACDTVLAGENVVLNPAYRALGLHGSEFHSLSYPARCGADGAAHVLRSMTPLSAVDASRLGLVDHVLAGSDTVLDAAIRDRVQALLSSSRELASWKQNVDVSPAALVQIRATELAQMAMDFWSARSLRYHQRRHDFVCKTRSCSTPLRFASHRRSPGMLDEEEDDRFDSVQFFEQKARQGVIRDLSVQMARLINDFSQMGFDETHRWAHGSATPATTLKSLVNSPPLDKSDESGQGAERYSSEPSFPCYYSV